MAGLQPNLQAGVQAPNLGNFNPSAPGIQPQQGMYPVPGAKDKKTGLPTGKGGPKLQDMNNQLGYMMNPMAMQGLQFLMSQQGGQQNRVLNALAALRPENRMGRVEQFRRDAMGQGLDQVRQQSGSFTGLDSSLLNALRAGAMNQSQQAGNEFMMQQYNPDRDVQSAGMAAQLLDPNVASPMLAQYMNWLMSSMGAQAATPKQPGILGTLASVAGSVLPGIKF